MRFWHCFSHVGPLFYPALFLLRRGCEPCSGAHDGSLWVTWACGMAVAPVAPVRIWGKAWDVWLGNQKSSSCSMIFPMEIAISWGYTVIPHQTGIRILVMFGMNVPNVDPGRMPICFLSEDASNTTCRFEWTNCHRFLGITMIAAYINLCIYLLSMSILYVYWSIYCRFFLSIFLIYLSFQSIYLIWSYIWSNLSFQSIKATYPALRHQIPHKKKHRAVASAGRGRQELSLPEAHGDGQPSATGGERSMSWGGFDP